jgi:hypothetical protein
MVDFGEKGYYYTEKEIFDYQINDTLVGDMTVMR